MKKLLVETAHRAARYIAEIANRQVVPLPADVARLEALGGPLPESPSDPVEVLALLDDIGSPATVATAGGRYFGFVIGHHPLQDNFFQLRRHWRHHLHCSVLVPGSPQPVGCQRRRERALLWFA